ncbi:MAG: cell division protein ZapD [Oceanococcaceae bacterium]
MTDTLQCYEHPLNERMRSALRLEFLFDEFRRFEAQADNRRGLIAVICDLLSLLSRADAWSEMAQDLQREIDQLEQLRAMPEVDDARLQQTINEATQARGALSRITPATVRIPKLLLTVMQRASVPGGLAPADVPGYTHWLRLPASVQQMQVLEWMQPLFAFETAVTLWLKLVRSRADWQTRVLEHGQITLQGKSRHLLMRVALPQEAPWYPEISGGRQRLNLRLRGADTTADEQARQVAQLDIALC